MPPSYARPCVGFLDKVITNDPFEVVTAAGSYHSRLFVALHVALFISEPSWIQIVMNYPIVQVNCLPVWVISSIKCPTVDIKFIRKNQSHLGSVFP